MLHLMLGGRTPQVNGQDPIVQSINNCYSSIRMETLGEVKTAIVIFCDLLMSSLIKKKLGYIRVRCTDFKQPLSLVKP